MQAASKGNRTSRWSWTVSLGIAAVLLTLSLRGIAWSDMAATIRHAQLEYIALSFVMLTLSFFTRGLRWRVLLNAERPVTRMTVFWATSVGYLGNSFLPARAGEFIRSVLVGRNTGLSKSYVLATALIERIMDVVALVLISLVALATLTNMPGWLRTAAQATAVLGLISTVVLFIAPAVEDHLKRLLRALPLSATVKERLITFLEQFLLGMRAFRNPRRALSFSVLTVAVWMIDALTSIEIGQALHLSLSFPAALLLLAALGLASAAPSTPGYVGIYQFVAVTVLPVWGFTRDQALVYIIAFQAITYAAVIVWGLLGLWQLRSTPPFMIPAG